ncbi:MAG TPA: SDR family oxidoreductase [Pseudomonas sp.]|nr:SDR family oxidoreductase [Pseudomonas sp.]
MRFNNKIAIVTGAAQGIGEAYAKRLAREGAAVAVADLNEAKGVAVAAAIKDAGGRAIFVSVDVSSPPSCIELAQTVERELGGIDFLINNAAIFAGMRYETPMTVDLDYYRRFMEVNMNGALYMSRAAVPFMTKRGGGVIINQSSTAANMDATASCFFYALSKLGVNGLTCALAAELGASGIRVNAVSPGPTQTEALDAVPKEHLEHIVAGLPLGRLGKTEDIANMVAFLLSEEASWITGKIFSVDGGQIRHAL